MRRDNITETEKVKIIIPIKIITAGSTGGYDFYILMLVLNL